MKSVRAGRFAFDVHFIQEPRDLRQQAVRERAGTPFITTHGYRQPASTDRDLVIKPDQLPQLRQKCSETASLRVRFRVEELEALSGFVMRPKHVAMNEYALRCEDRMPDPILMSSATEPFEACRYPGARLESHCHEDVPCWRTTAAPKSPTCRQR